MRPELLCSGTMLWMQRVFLNDKPFSICKMALVFVRIGRIGQWLEIFFLKQKGRKFSANVFRLFLMVKMFQTLATLYAVTLSFSRLGNST